MSRPAWPSSGWTPGNWRSPSTRGRSVPRERGGAEARRLLVKIYGRDAYDTRFLAKLWRSVWYRGSVARIAMTRLESAEHEAFVTLLVANGGVATLDVVTAGSTADDDALLVLRGEARALRALPEAELDDDLVRAAWAALGRLEALGSHTGESTRARWRSWGPRSASSTSPTRPSHPMLARSRRGASSF